MIRKRLFFAATMQLGVALSLNLTDVFVDTWLELSIRDVLQTTTWENTAVDLRVHIRTRLLSIRY